jgi:prepilin-type N-terminal cleavage/methylation domain-containing protein/prepilin-type processing-associated H-X9-DG protein
MHARTLRPRSQSAFSLIELLVVVAIILILLGIIVPVSRNAKEKSNFVTCAHNMKTILAGLLMHPASNDGYLPWAGGVDRNYHNDWVWGGQGDKAAAMVPARFGAADWGFHPEAGATHTLITGQPRVFATAASVADWQKVAPGGGKPYENATYNTMEHRTYRCPSTGELGKSLRVNFSVNDAYDTQWADSNMKDPPSYDTKSWTHMKWKAQRSKYGVRLSTLKGPSHKIFLANEDPRTMKNASFAPGGSAAGDEILDGDNPHVTHDGRINIGFADGHIGQFKGEFVLDSQKTDIISPDGKLNNRQYWYGPAD